MINIAKNNKIVKAKKDHICSEHSYHCIKKGDFYLYQVLLPWHDLNQWGKYQKIKACLRCAKEYGMLNSDQRKQLEEIGK